MDANIYAHGLPVASSICIYSIRGYHTSIISYIIHVVKMEKGLQTVFSFGSEEMITALTTKVGPASPLACADQPAKLQLKVCSPIMTHQLPLHQSCTLSADT